MKSLVGLIFISSLLSTSCKSDTEIQKSITPKNVVPFTVVGNQMKAQSTSEQQINSNNPSSTTTAATGMNPAHGQPGHICEIPVGAPLNSPATSNNQQNAPVPTVTTTPAQSAPNPVEQVATTEGANPPHGQANHRCDIAVGAPLPKA